MSSVGKICLYCSAPIATEDRVSCCDRCYAAHHEACWERNGRCSTFRCAGLPRTMRGADLPAVLQTAILRANEQPQICPFCGGQAYAGVIQGRRPKHLKNHPDGPGLVFSAAETEPRRGLFKRRPRSWWLPGAHLRARSCGRCRRLFLWGVPVDEQFLQKLREAAGERYCPHCASGLLNGEIVLNRKLPGGAQFECDDAPEFHKDWLGHNLLDRFILNRWSPPVSVLPALSCDQCQYTEVSGRPIYRFL